MPGGNPHIKAIRAQDKITPCIELHCAAVSEEHLYGDPRCSWVLRMGSVVAKSELNGHKNRRPTGKNPA